MARAGRKNSGQENTAWVIIKKNAPAMGELLIE